jgi:hypothetical protein
MGELIKIMPGDICVECQACGSQSWIVILDPKTCVDFIRLECANPDCDQVIPFDDDESIEFTLEDDQCSDS